jgi:hypothetical protein
MQPRHDHVRLDDRRSLHAAYLEWLREVYLRATGVGTPRLLSPKRSTVSARDFIVTLCAVLARDSPDL